ncbi:hypothetical protein ACFLX5_03885 [Chloroflexota bacterium]
MEYIAGPDAQERLARALDLILRAAARAHEETESWEPGHNQKPQVKEQ